VTLDDLHQPYAAWCRDGGRRMLARDEFATRFAELLRFAGMTTEHSGRRLVVCNARLVVVPPLGQSEEKGNRHA
jgi:hypothetical protein